MAGAILGPMHTDPARVPRSSVAPDPAPLWLVDVIVPAALAWAVIMAAYLVWSFLTGHDEARLIAELDASYPLSPDATSD